MNLQLCEAAQWCGTQFGQLLLPKHRCSAAAAALQQLDVRGSAVGAHGAERAEVGLGRGAADVGREEEVWMSSNTGELNVSQSCTSRAIAARGARKETACNKVKGRGGNGCTNQGWYTVLCERVRT